MADDMDISSPSADRLADELRGLDDRVSRLEESLARYERANELFLIQYKAHQRERRQQEDDAASEGGMAATSGRGTPPTRDEPMKLSDLKQSKKKEFTVSFS